MKFLSFILLVLVSFGANASDMELGTVKAVKRTYTFDITECEKNWESPTSTVHTACRFNEPLNSNELVVLVNGKALEDQNGRQGISLLNEVVTVGKAQYSSSIGIQRKNNDLVYSLEFKKINGISYEGTDFKTAKPYIENLLKQTSSNEIEVTVLKYE